MSWASSGALPDLGAGNAQAALDLASAAPPDLDRVDLARPAGIDLAAPADLMPAAPGGPFACAPNDFTSACAPAIALSCSGAAAAFAIDGADLYLLNSNSSDPATVPTGGVYRWHDGVSTLVAPIARGNALVLDGDQLYVGAIGGLWRVGTDGSALTQLADDFVVALTADADRLYWIAAVPPTAASPSYEIHSMPKAGGSVTTLVSDELLPYGLTVDDSRLYWSAASATGAALRSMPKGGGATTTVASFANSGGGAVARASDGVIFTAFGDDAGGALFSYAPASGAAQSVRLLAPAGTGATFLPMVVADADVAFVSYWTQDGKHPSAASHTDRLDRASGTMTSFDHMPYTSGALVGGTFYGLAGALFRSCK